VDDKNKKLIRNVAAATLVVGGLFLLYKRDKLTWDDLLVRDYKIASLASVVKPKYDELNRTAPIKKKLEHLRPQLESKNWVYQYGASLVVFGEFEHFLESLLHKHKQKIQKNMIKKLGTLKGSSIISDADYHSTSQLFELRNKLAHGNYKQIRQDELIHSYNLISSFVAKYS